MSEFTVYLGNKRLSSWSLRAWLMLKLSAINFNEVVIELYQADTQEQLRKISPAGKVPVLKHNSVLIWDSLAIGEYLAELFPQLWPRDPLLRAKARSISSEMHSSFPLLRQHLPFNTQLRLNNFIVPENVTPEIQRITEIWSECRKQSSKDGKYLFGDFTIADAMFAPVALRFFTYGVELPTIAKEYITAILEHPAIQEWMSNSS